MKNSHFKPNLIHILTFSAFIVFYLFGCSGTTDPPHVEPKYEFQSMAQSGSTQEEIQNFIGPGNSFKAAFLLRDDKRAFYVAYIDFAAMENESFPIHVFEKTRSAMLPSISPNGKYISYHSGGTEVSTDDTSQIHLISIADSSITKGPPAPSTNVRWWWNATDTALVWCDKTENDGWLDSTSATWRQYISGTEMLGQPEKLADGNFNGGLSLDGNYLASGADNGVMLNRATGELKYFHKYPNRTVQVCNASISLDPNNPSTFMFLDFGIGIPEADDTLLVENMIRPKRYVQHQHLLFGSFNSTAGGRIDSYIDSPRALLDSGYTWEDPEWTTHPDFLVAASHPARSINDPQKDLFLIKKSTGEWIKLASIEGLYLPVAWIGAKE